MGERNESAEQETWQEAKCSKAIRQKKKRREKTKNSAKRGYAVTKKPATTNSAKLEIVKWVEKNN